MFLLSLALISPNVNSGKYKIYFMKSKCWITELVALAFAVKLNLLTVALFPFCRVGRLATPQSWQRLTTRMPCLRQRDDWTRLPREWVRAATLVRHSTLWVMSPFVANCLNWMAWNRFLWIMVITKFYNVIGYTLLGTLELPFLSSPSITSCTLISSLYFGFLLT